MSLVQKYNPLTDKFDLIDDSGGGSAPIGTITASAPKITQSLVAGDNTVNHGIGTAGGGEVVSVSVQNNIGKFVTVTVNVIDNNNININLAGGSLPNASIFITYKLL